MQATSIIDNLKKVRPTHGKLYEINIIHFEHLIDSKMKIVYWKGKIDQKQ
jgi:streptomycin 6-kinase